MTTPNPITRDGRFEATQVQWDDNGSFTVVVTDHKANLHDIAAAPAPSVVRAARALARRAVPHPEDIQWSRFDAVRHLVHAVGYQFTVSRLGPEHR